MTTPPPGRGRPAVLMCHRLQISLDHAGLTVDDMARALEMHPTIVRRWLSGKARPPKRELEAWAQQTGATYRWLITVDGSALED